jgi:hypothetical protein
MSAPQYQMGIGLAPIHAFWLGLADTIHQRFALLRG